MKNAYVVYSKYYDVESKKPTVGGVQTYLNNLCDLLNDLGFAVVLVQYGSDAVSLQIENRQLIQLAAKSLSEYRKQLIPLAKQMTPEDIWIYGTDTLINPDISIHHSIAIQHGIYWDIPSEKNRSLIRSCLASAIESYRFLKRVNRVDYLVCVDYNFKNWYHALIRQGRLPIRVIPNYTRIAERFAKPEESIRIIFARRLYPYRGTRQFTNAIRRVMEAGYPVEVTIAGTGPDESWMREQLASYPSVRFIQYAAEDSLKVHADQHIAVVPTVGSEGTSLSLLEAMSAQCAVICTDVGGMTNIVLNGMNGLMVPAGDEDALYRAMVQLIEKKALRKQLAECAYQTVQSAFSLERWQADWKLVIHEMENSRKDSLGRYRDEDGE